MIHVILHANNLAVKLFCVRYRLPTVGLDSANYSSQMLKESTEIQTLSAHSWVSFLSIVHLSIQIAQV